MKYTDREREQRRIASRKWKRRNRLKVKAALALWLENNKKRRAVWEAAYMERTKEYRKQRAAKWHRSNRNNPAKKARRKAYMKVWMAKNRGKKAGYFAKRKAAKLGAQLGNVKAISSWIQRWRKRIKVHCYWCLERFYGTECHADHIVPLSKGGAHSIENLCIACIECNQRKHDKLPSDWNTQITEPVLF